MTLLTSIPRCSLLLAALTWAACAAANQGAIAPAPIPPAEPPASVLAEPEPAPPGELIGPRFGGTGGSAAQVRCPLAHGLQGQSGEYIDRIGLVCFLEDRAWDSPSYGGTGGARFTRLCPEGARAIGIFGRAGAYVDQLGLLCSDSQGQPSASQLQGGSGGSQFVWACPPGYALSGLDLMTGDYVDSVAAVCRQP